LHVDDHYSIAVIVPGGREKLVSTTQRELTHDRRRHVRITRFCQVAVRRSADEAAFTLWIEPTRRFTIGYYRCDRGALTLITAWSPSGASSSATATAALLLTLSAASALIASATAVVSMIAVTRMARLVRVPLLAAAPAGLRIVLRLLRRIAGALSTRSVRSILCRRTG
jgi:hypothetical protein